MQRHTKRKTQKRFQLKGRTRQKQYQRNIIVTSLVFLFVCGGLLIFLNSRSEDAYAAVNYTWTGNTGTDWNISTNWTPAGIPTSGDNVIIGAAINQPELTGDVTLNNITTNTGAQPNLKGFKLTINGNGSFNGGTISDGGPTGALLLQGTNAVFGNSAGGPTINVSLTVSTSNFTLRNTTTNSIVSLTKNGGGNDNSYGNNTFNGPVVVSNNGTAQLVFSYNVKDVYNDDVTFNNNSTSYIYVAHNDASGTLFNGNIKLNSISGSGILFGAGTGTATLAPSKTISIGSDGFSSGLLVLRHFTYSGTNDITFNTTGNTSIT